MLNLLSFFFSVVEDYTTHIVFVISIITAFLLLAILVILCAAKKNYPTKTIAYASICIATSFALSFIKIKIFPNGGSVTLASFVPILIFAYCFGFVNALLVGLIYGLLQFIQDPYILTYATFFLDYILAFSSITIMSIMRKLIKKIYASVIIGVIGVYFTRFLFHFLSGLIFFYNGAIYYDLPKSNAFIYSFLYNSTYIFPEMIICIVVFTILLLSKSFKYLTNFLEK